MKRGKFWLKVRNFKAENFAQKKRSMPSFERAINRSSGSNNLDIAV